MDIVLRGVVQECRLDGARGCGPGRSVTVAGDDLDLEKIATRSFAWWAALLARLGEEAGANLGRIDQRRCGRIGRIDRGGGMGS
jgi:hypothetical protein